MAVDIAISEGKGDVNSVPAGNSDFTLVVANGVLQLIDTPIEAVLLSVLSEKELTKSQMSRESKIPITTVVKHIQKMVNRGLVTVKDVDGRDFYTNNSRILLSTDYSRLSNSEASKDVVAHMMEGEGDIFMYIFSWMLVELESLGADPSFLAVEFGNIVGELFTKQTESKNVEGLINELSRFITERRIMDKITVVTYLPLTFRAEYKCPFESYPFHLTQFILVNIVKSVMEGYLHSPQYVSGTKVDVDSGTNVATLEFSIMSKYDPEYDPWKVVFGKKKWWMN